MVLRFFMFRWLRVLNMVWLLGILLKKVMLVEIIGFFGLIMCRVMVLVWSSLV